MGGDKIGREERVALNREDRQYRYGAFNGICLWRPYVATKKYSPPTRSIGDVAHATGKAALSAVPFVGGPAVELFSQVIQPPLEKRRSEWMEMVGEALEELEKGSIGIDELQGNEEFISAVMHASQIALRTHQSEKLDALKNAVINVATREAPDETLQHMFINLVDTFTPWHVRILKLFQYPPALPHITAGGLSMVLEAGYPELRGQRVFYDLIWRELFQHSLVTTEGLHVTMSATGLAQKRTSEFGDQFIQFITRNNK